MPPKKPLVPRKPCPDPERYDLVYTKRTAYWRLKRGLGGPVTLNTALQDQADRMKLAMPAAKRLLQALHPYAQDLAIGYAQVRLGALLARGMSMAGMLDYRMLGGFELQQEYPLDGLLKTGYLLKPARGKLQVIVSLPEDGMTGIKNQLITGYQLQLVLVVGNLADAELPLDTFSDCSSIFERNGPARECTLSVRKPPANVPWLLLLRMSYREQDAPANHPKYKAMRVIMCHPEGNY